MPKPIGIYALGPVSLPNPPIPKATLLMIERAIGEAWRVIKDEPQDGFRLDLADEERITLELRNCLVDRVLDGQVMPGFTPDKFWVSREAKFESYNGKHLKKMPDLHIGVVRNVSPGLRSQDGVFVECKPVDDAHNLVTHYCDKGIIRFVRGEYAWAMPNALMIGYAGDGYSMPAKLEDALRERRAKLKSKGVVTACPDTAAGAYTHHPHITTHRRGFTYPSTGTKAPQIVLRHLWFDRN